MLTTTPQRQSTLGIFRFRSDGNRQKYITQTNTFGALQRWKNWLVAYTIFEYEISVSIETRPPLWSMGNIVTSHAAGRGSIPYLDYSWWRFFPGFPLNRKTNVRKFGPHSYPVIIWPSYIIQTIYRPSMDGDGLTRNPLSARSQVKSIVSLIWKYYVNN